MWTILINFNAKATHTQHQGHRYNKIIPKKQNPIQSKGQLKDRGCLNCKRNSVKIKSLKILNYHLKLSGPQLSHLDRPPTFAVYILILQRSGAWAAPDFASNATILKVC